MKKTYRVTLFFLLFLCALAGNVVAQCPMCKTAVESSLAKGNSSGKGLNDGILYLMVAPYIAVLSIGFLWYKKYKRKVA